MGPGVCPPCPRGWAGGPSALGRELDCLTVESGSCCLGGRPSSVAPGCGPASPCKQGCSLLAAASRAQLPLPRGPGSQHGVGLRRTSRRRSRGTARKERAAGAASSSSRVDRRGKSQPSALAASSSEAQPQEAVGRRGKSGGVVLEIKSEAQEPKRDARGPLGKGLFPGQGTFRVRRPALRWATSLRAGLVLAVLGLLPRAPLAARREGRPCKGGRESPCLRTAGGKRSSPGPQPSYPVSRAGLFPNPGSLLPAAGPWPACPPVLGACHSLCPWCRS
ncbi:uncharacterized protein LOC135442305 [Zonotrichia leucophrys gambelii]|uniref:uncharacterized protein LOC135442305 n=1 Tax=Zonotrichia leucophrys gambelii TaxID=257770 RepID=UPI003140C279